MRIENRAYTKDNEYVRTRYLVTRETGTVGSHVVVKLAERVRELVRNALDFDEFGHPKGAPWAAGEPADLVGARKQWEKS